MTIAQRLPRLSTGTKVNYYDRNGQLVGKGKITGRGSKNGMPVYDVKLRDGELFWGYREQFTLVQVLGAEIAEQAK